MLFRMLFFFVQEYFTNQFAAIFDMPGRFFLAYQGLLAFSLLMVINTGLVFSPVCKLSVLTNTSFCAFVNDARGYTLPYAAVFESHSEVLTEAMEGTSVAESSSLDLTQAHIAIDDLVLLVDHSDISRKTELASSLEQLREETRLAGHHLQNFASNLGGSVERIVLANGRVLKGLESRSKLSALHDWCCTTFRLSRVHSLCPSASTIQLDRAYRNALLVLETELTDLLSRSVRLIRVLDEIDERLRTVLSLVRAEEADVKFEKEELYGQLWTILGFNRRLLLHFDRSSTTLTRVGSYTLLARHYVASTHSRLYEMQGDVERLRKTGSEGANGGWLTLEEAAILVKEGIFRLQIAQRLREQRYKSGLEGRNESFHEVDAVLDY